MARAKYIYLAASTHPEDPEAAFTVKHEAVAWIGRQPKPWAFSLYRYRDGGSPTYGYDTYWNWDELQEAA